VDETFDSALDWPGDDAMWVKGRIRRTRLHEEGKFIYKVNLELLVKNDQQVYQDMQRNRERVPWPTRILMAELSLQDHFISPQSRSYRLIPYSPSLPLNESSFKHSTEKRLQKRRVNTFFSQHFDGKHTLMGRWTENMMAGIDCASGHGMHQVVVLTVHLMDPLRIASNLKRQMPHTFASSSLITGTFRPHQRKHNDVVVTFANSTKRFYASSHLLSAKSSYFNALLHRFQHDTDEHRNTVLHVPEGVSVRVMYHLLEYVHTSHISLPPTHPKFPLLPQAALYFGIRYVDLLVLSETLRYAWPRYRLIEAPLPEHELFAFPELQRVLSVANTLASNRSALDESKCKDFKLILQHRVKEGIMSLIAYTLTITLAAIAIPTVGPFALAFYVYTLVVYGGFVNWYRSL
jgi:hypothetical protein